MKNPNGLLMIEPTCAATVPLIDELTRKVTALRRAVIDPETRRRFRGMHQCTGAGDCRAHSDNSDHAIAVGGVPVQTNSLIVHYVACHRADIDDVERHKIETMFRELGLDEQMPTTRELAGWVIHVAGPEDLPPEMGGTRKRVMR